MPATMFPPGRFPLVGRDEELDVAQQALEEALGGDGRVVLLSGEPGIGKTRLVEELAALAEDQGALVAWGRVDDVDGAPPYWPWMQLLEDVFAGVDRELLAEALGDRAAPIGAVVPWIAELAPAVAPSPLLDPSAARFRLHLAILEAIRAIAARRALLLVLEDMHWADASSLELTRFAAARLMGVPMMLVVTYRTVDGGDTRLLHDVLASLARQPALQRIALGGLSASEVGLFMAHTTGLRPRRAAAASVHARSEGNPFFVGEIARLQHSEAAEHLAGTDDAVPLGVRDVIRRRLARLPAQTRELLTLASVLGRELVVAMLAACADVGETEVASALEPALAAGLLAERGGRLQFSHALVRDTVYRELSALGRATLHARVGETLEQRRGSLRAPVAELAWHFAHAAPVLGPERGLAYTLQAADAAQSGLSHERAEADLRRALTLIEMLPEDVDRWERELDVQNRLAALIFLTQGMAAPAAGHASARARELCERIGETDALFHTLTRLGVFHHNRGEFSVVLELGEQLLAIGGQRDSPEWLTSGYLLVGMAQLHVGELRSARESLARARTAAAGLDLTAEVANAFFSLHPTVVALLWSSRCAWVLGGAAEARAFADESLDVATRVAHPHTTGMALFLRLHLDVLERDAPRVLEQSRQAVAYCDEHGLAAWAVWLRMLRGWATCELGDPDDGVARMTVEMAASYAAGSASNRPIFLSLLADGELRRGDHARALALIDQAFGEMREMLIWQSDLHRRRGELLALQGPRHRARALDELREAVAVAEQQGAVGFGRIAEAALARLAPAPGPGRPPAPAGADAANLSPRERELLGLVARGLTDKEIAGELVISLATVRSHLDRIRDKTGRRRRPELSRLADELGLRA